MEIKLKAEKRETEETGKGPARRMRRAGEIPAVLYGLGTEASPIKVRSDDLKEVLHTKAGANVLIDLVVTDGKAKENHLVMIKEIQRHPFKERLLHVDFMKVARDETVTARVPIALVGEEDSVGLRAGGTLQHTLWEIEVECLPQDLPDHIIADVSSIDIGENVRVGDLKRIPKVTVLTDESDPVLTILAPRLIAEEKVEEEGVAEAAVEEAAPAEERPEEVATQAEGEGS